MEIKLDVFGRQVHEGDLVLRSGGGGATSFIPCKVIKINYYKNGQAIKNIVVVHPWWDRLQFWNTIRKILSPHAELIKITPDMMSKYQGHRESWRAGFTKELLGEAA